MFSEFSVNEIMQKCEKHMKKTSGVISSSKPKEFFSGMKQETTKNFWWDDILNGILWSTFEAFRGFYAWLNHSKHW